jgi:hypothetical protein
VKLGVLMKELTARMPGRMTTSIKHQRPSISWLGQQAPICYLVRIVALLAGLSACTRKDHLDLESPWFTVDEQQLALHVSWSGWLQTEQRRVSYREIGPKVLDMIANARSAVVISVFLFDNFYSEEPTTWDVVAAITDAIIKQKVRYPDLVVALILDPSNRAYSNRIAPAVARLSAAGADVFYSDLLATNAHTPLKLVEALHHGSRALSQATGGRLGDVIKPALAAIKIPFMGDFDQHPANMQMALNAALIKANHRKIVVTDRGKSYEALISSANPHNASVSSINFAVSATGPIARYIYNTQRLDIAHSISLQDNDYAYWHQGANDNYRKTYLDEVLTELPAATPPLIDNQQSRNAARVKFITEGRIKDHLLAILQAVSPGDELRIQMFYLSDLDVVNALMKAAMITRSPIKLLLDPSKDAFGKIKDGTPNRQVAALLTGNLDRPTLKRLQHYFPDVIRNAALSELNIALRWFDTHGEQNHAKIMSITNKAQGKFILLHGSANWTGKNLSGINMEANIRVDGSPALVGEFNHLFERFFNNTPVHHDLVTPHPHSNFADIRYSVAYEHPVYREHSGIGKWLNGEKFGFVSW